MHYRETPITFQDSAGHVVSGILAEPDHPTTHLVILCHGFLSQKNSRTNLRLTELFTQKGIATFRFDWFGMGESSGEFAAITVDVCCDQLAQAIQQMQRRSYTQLGVIGSSFGGLIAILVAGSQPSIRALGLKCPVPDFPEMLRLELGETGMERWRQTDTIPNVAGGAAPISLRYQFYESCCRVNAYAQARAITIPTIIVFGDQDEFVPLHQIHQLARALGNPPQLHILPGANHHFGRPEDFRQMTTLLAEGLAAFLTGEQSRKTPNSG